MRPEMCTAGRPVARHGIIITTTPECSCRRGEALWGDVMPDYFTESVAAARRFLDCYHLNQALLREGAPAARYAVHLDGLHILAVEGDIGG